MSSSRKFPPSSRRGFALLLTITLLAFLVLLLVSLASLTCVETQVANNSRHLAQARHNALYALNIALGELQKNAGPDQRVTARAEIDPTSVATNRRWTGVWNSDPASPNFGQRLAWLVSGAAPAVQTATADPGPSGVSATAVRLVGPHTADLSTSVASDANRVDVSTEEIRSDSVAGLASVPGGHLVGRYGWWVGDEGVRARVNLADRFAASGTTPDLNDKLNRLRSAPRAALELMDDAQPGDLQPDLIAAVPLFDKLLDRAQFPLFSSDASTGERFRAMNLARYHDYTPWSAGVQADVRAGGLKRDLSVAFEYPDALFDASDLSSGNPSALPVAGSTRLAVPIFSRSVSDTETLQGPPWHLLRNHYRLYKNRNLANASQPVDLLATTPNSRDSGVGQQFNVAMLFSGGGAKSSDPNTHPLVGISGSTPKNITRPLGPQVAPAIARIFFAYGLRSEPTGFFNSSGVPIYRVILVFTPYVVLHNPYDAPLSLRDLDGDGFSSLLVFATPTFRARIQVTTGSGTVLFPSTATSGVANGQLLQAYANNENPTPFSDSAAVLRVALPALTFAPGEVKIFSADTGLVKLGANGNTRLNLRNQTRYDGGYYFEKLNGQDRNVFGPGFAPFACPTGPGGSTEGPQPPSGAPTVSSSATEVWVAAGNQVGLVLNPDLTASNNYQIRFVAESAPGDTTGGGMDGISQLQNLQLRTPNTNQANTDIGRLTGYDTVGGPNVVRGNLPVENLTGATTFLLAHDVYLKSADEDVRRRARPYVANDPLAPAQAYTALGDAPLGFPGTMPAYQMRFIDLNNGTLPLLNFVPQPPGGLQSYWGTSQTAAGLTSLSLLKLPSQPAFSLGEFQHAPLSLHGYQPRLAVGNSFANPYLPLDAVTFDSRQSGKIANTWTLHDQSYLLNEALWDSSFLSSVSPAYDSASGLFAADASSRSAASTAADWLRGTAALPNARMVRHTRDAEAALAELLDTSGGTAVFRANAHRKIAAHLLTLGSFNINSRSIDAWAAVLGGNRLAPVVENASGSTREVGGDQVVARLLPNSVERTSSPDAADTWRGFARLDSAALRTLAAAIVDEISQRQTRLGRPFLSLGEFINRRLVSGSTPDNVSGPLQAALDRPGGPNDAFLSSPTNADAQRDTEWPFRSPAAGVGPVTATAQGYVLQADLLQQIGPFLSARSDTFTIRTFGETFNPITGASEGRAWCEAVVQRTPVFVDSTDAPETAVASVNSTNQTFGRRFQVVSFRWLTPEDI